MAVVSVFAFSSPEKPSEIEDFTGCGEHGRIWLTACSSGCLTIIQGNEQRLPTDAEFNSFRNIQDENCNALFPNTSITSAP